MSEPIDNSDVGYGKPPKEHQFKKGKSGNPKGRPMGSGNKRAAGKQFFEFGTQPANQMLLEEAYRPVTIREGDRSIELPAIQAVFRAIGVSAIKGNRHAQRNIAELVQRAEEEHYKLRSEHIAMAIEYKTGWNEIIERARFEGRPEPALPPLHPNDVIIDLKTCNVVYAGPTTPEEKLKWDKQLARRAGAQESVNVYAADYREESDPKMREILLKEWHHEQRIFDLINDNLPVHYRTKLENRSFREGSSKPGDQKRNKWPE